MTDAAIAPSSHSQSDCPQSDVRPQIHPSTVLAAFALALIAVVATRWPVMRMRPADYDEFNFVEITRTSLLPAQHTLFLALGRILGSLVGDAYQGIVFLDMLVSALALTSAWWWLRASVQPRVALAATVVLGVGPVFWAYGAMAGNYTAIIAVGSFLLGVATRTRTDPQPWHPFAAAAVLAVGTGYRSDIGTLWLAVFFVILWQHRWRRALAAMGLFTIMNLAWIVPMIHDVGGWEAYIARNRDFAYHSGFLNSVWNLGIVDAPLRYAVKVIMALVWTLGPGLVFAPRGLLRLTKQSNGFYLVGLLILSVVPALGSHLLVHFGVPGYSFHYVPALLLLLALGIGRVPAVESENPPRLRTDLAQVRLMGLAVTLALLFWFYPGEYQRPGLKSDFDLAFARHTRAGLLLSSGNRAPRIWRTANSVNEPSPATNN